MNYDFKQVNDWVLGPVRHGGEGIKEKNTCVSCFKCDFLLHLHSFNRGPFV